MIFIKRKKSSPRKEVKFVNSVFFLLSAETNCNTTTNVAAREGTRDIFRKSVMKKKKLHNVSRITKPLYWGFIAKTSKLG